jgi:hypothetical protein
LGLPQSPRYHSDSCKLQVKMHSGTFLGAPRSPRHHSDSCKLQMKMHFWDFLGHALPRPPARYLRGSRSLGPISGTPSRGLPLTICVGRRTGQGGLRAARAQNWPKRPHDGLTTRVELGGFDFGGLMGWLRSARAVSAASACANPMTGLR